MTTKTKVTNMLVIGFAMFAMFFGAGNLIFPPFLGFQTGTNWFLSFLGFIVMDVFFSIFALIVIAKKNKGAEGISGVLGEKWSVLFLSTIVICIGPLVSIPRTAATTFEMGIQPIFPGVNSWVVSIIFFTIAGALSLKPSKIIDIIGSVLAPILILTLGFMIFKGILSPLGIPVESITLAKGISKGISAGYQTMDMMGAIIFSIVIIASIEQRGYESVKDKVSALKGAGFVAALALFGVYCGLAYLGATVSNVYSADITQAELVIALSKSILGDRGMALFGLIVAAACLTTAIGLLSSCAGYLSNVTGGKIKYEQLVIGFAIFSAIVSNFGIAQIISLAAPILGVMYPVLVVLTILAAFSEKIKNDNAYKGAAIGAFCYGIITVLEGSLGIDYITASLPLASFGFGWVLPATIGFIFGSLITKNQKLPEKELL